MHEHMVVLMIQSSFKLLNLLQGLNKKWKQLRLDIKTTKLRCETVQL